MNEGVTPPSLDDLEPELALVREAGLDPLAIEPLLPRLPKLSGLTSVGARTRVATPLGTATAITQLVREAAESLESPAPTGSGYSSVAQAQMLFRVHYATKGLSPAEARFKTQIASGVGDRQYRARREQSLLRLVAQAVLEHDRASQLQQSGRALAAGVEVPQSVALYWLNLFRDHYFRLETSAYALQVDLMTAHGQLRDNLSSWRGYLAAAVYWNVEFSYLRHRFFRLHGPLWFAPTDAGCAQLCDAAERIEYHDAFPDDFMARLRRLYGAAEDPDHDTFMAALREADLDKFTLDTAEAWMRRCQCPMDGEPDRRCEVHLVIRHCDLFGQTVESEFERIQAWYREPRHAVEAGIRELIENYRAPERP
jgi:hypothetical protein